MGERAREREGERASDSARSRRWDRLSRSSGAPRATAATGESRLALRRTMKRRAKAK